MTRRVVLIHPSSETRAALAEALVPLEVIEADSRASILPRLAELEPVAVVSHHIEFKKLLRDLERQLPAAARLALCSAEDLDGLQTLEACAAQGFDFATIDPAHPQALRSALLARASMRLAPAAPWRAVVEIAGRHLEGEIREVSSEGIGFACRVVGPPRFELRSPASLTVLDHLGALVIARSPWQLQTVRGPIDGELLLGFRVVAPIDASATHNIRDSVAIRGHLRRAIHAHCSIELQLEDGENSHAFEVLHFEGRGLRLESPPPRRVRYRLGGVARLSFEHRGVHFSALTSVLDSSETAVVVAMPTLLRRRNRRTSLRVRFAPDSPDRICFTHPLTGARVRRPLLDLQAGGAAFSFDPGNEAFPPGLILREVELELGTATVPCEARVQHSSTSDQPTYQSRRCGVALSSLSSDARQVVLDRIVYGLSSSVSDAHEEPPRVVWGLYHATRFAFPDYSTERAEPPVQFDETHRRLPKRAGQVTKAFLFRDKSGAPVGHASGLRIYSKSWISQHLVVLPGYHRSTHVAKTLVNLTFDFGEALPDVQHVRGFWRASNRWSNRVFGPVTTRLKRPGMASVRTFTPVRRPMGGALPPPPLTSREADGEAERLLLRHLAKTDEPIWLEGDDLIEGELHLESLSGMYEQLGLRRHRRIVVVDGRDGPRGWALLEEMSPFLNLTEFYSGARLVLVEPGAPDADAVRSALVQAAVEDARRQGRPATLVLARQEDLGVLGTLGFSENFGTCFELCCHRSQTRELTRLISSVFDRLEA